MWPRRWVRFGRLGDGQAGARTRTGKLELAVVPLPSPPLRLYPQHSNCPLVIKAQFENVKELTEATPEAMPMTCVEATGLL